MKGIALSTQPFDSTSDKMRRNDSTKRGTRWRGRRAKSIGAESCVSIGLVNAGSRNGPRELDTGSVNKLPCRLQLEAKVSVIGGTELDELHR
jgi:hypothetical protein